MKKLLKWLKANEVSNKKLASMIECSEANVSRLTRGQFLPGVRLAVRIERVTMGAVRCQDW